MESNYILILIVILALLVLGKIIKDSIYKIMKKGEKFMDTVDELGIYHNNVGSNMRTIGYEQDNEPITTHNLTDITGLIDGESVKLEKVSDTAKPYYQMEFSNSTTIYGLLIKSGYVDSSNNSNNMIFDIKYSTGSTDKQAFMPLLDENNSKKTLTLSANQGIDDNDTIPEEKELPVPITAKYLRIYNIGAGTVNLNIDAIIKPMTYISLKIYDTKQVNVKDDDGNDKTVDIGESSYYVSHIDSSSPLKPYSDKLGKREIFKLDVRTQYFNFEELNIRNKPTFDAYIIRSARGTDGEFCYLNTTDNGIYCDRTIYQPSVLLRFHITVSDINNDDDHGHTMIVQDFKSGLYADNQFKFTVKNVGNAQKYIINKHSSSEIMNIVNLDDYIDKKEELADQKFNDCKNKTFTYVNISRPYNDITLMKEHTNALINRKSKLPKTITHIPASSIDQEGIYIETNSDHKDIKFKIIEDGTIKDVGARYRYKLWNNTSGSRDKQKNGPFCSGPSVDKPEYIYDSLRIGTDATAVNEFDSTHQKYKPEMYEGAQVGDKYIAEVKKHTPVSLTNYTPETIKICIPNTALGSSGDLNQNEIILKTQLFNVINNDGKNMNLEFKIQNDHLIKNVECKKGNIVNNMFKIKKTGEGYYELVSPNDPEYKKIDCNCNCLGDQKHIDEYRKTNNFVKSILDNVIVKTDNIMSQRNQELTEIRTQEETLFNQPDIQDYNNYETTNLLDTNPFTKTDEIQNYYNQAGVEGFSDMSKLPTDLESLKDEFIGMYKPFDSQFLLLDGVTLQLDNNFIGFIKNKTPVYKLRHDQIMPFISPYGNFDGIKIRLVGKDKMVHTIENRNFEKLLEYIGLTPPNIIYISRHQEKHEDTNSIRIYYKISNRQHTTLMQMEKI